MRVPVRKSTFELLVAHGADDSMFTERDWERMEMWHRDRPKLGDSDTMGRRS
jgi:hypothetical protein